MKEVLHDRRRRLRPPSVRLHLERPRFRFGTISLSNGLGSALPSALGPYVRVNDSAAMDSSAQTWCSWRDYKALAAASNPTSLCVENCPAAPYPRGAF